jgi:ATP-dependent DNA ligase
LRGILEEVRFALDSPLEGTGFEVPVPREIRFGFRGLVVCPLLRRGGLIDIAGSPNTGVHWVRPELVAEVKFLAWTEDNLLRQVVYAGLREDKPARGVRREVPKPVA